MKSSFSIWIPGSLLENSKIEVVLAKPVDKVEYQRYARNKIAFPAQVNFFLSDSVWAVILYFYELNLRPNIFLLINIFFAKLTFLKIYFKMNNSLAFSHLRSSRFWRIYENYMSLLRHGILWAELQFDIDHGK